MNLSLLFKSVLYISFMGSIVAAILILLKILFKDKLSARWHYCIWFLLIMRLILPYAPESQLSVFNLFPHVTPNIEISQAVKISEPDIKNPIVDTQLQGNDLQTAINENIETTVQEEANADEPVFNNYLDIIGLIWIVGAGIMLLYIFSLNIAFYLSMRRNPQCSDEGTLKILEECKSLMKVRKNIPVIYSEGNKPPFLLGIFKPKLIVPSTVFDKLSFQEKRYIFLHEIAHLKRMDILVNSLMLILKSIHWFNPIIWYSCYKMQEDCEIACDARVLSCLEPIEYKRYGETAIDLLKVFSKSYWVPGTAGITGDGTGIKRRIHMIARFKKNSLVWTLIAIILFLSLGFICLTNSGKSKGIDESKKTVENFLTTLYTVTQDDFEYYQKMINGAKPDELKSYDEIYENTTAKFKTYLSDKSYEKFYAERLSYLRIKSAFENSYFTKIKSIKVDKIKEEKQNRTATYHYEIEINQINSETSKEEITRKSGTLTISKENGFWKVLDGIRI